MSTRFDALAIAGSAGSLPVICTALEGLDADTVLATVVIAHTAERDARNACDVLGGHCRLPVVEAEEGAPVASGRVHVAAGGYHLLVERSRQFALCAGERIHHSRPSIDVIFETMAEAYGRHLAGMLVSGANTDGADGLYAIHRLGGTTAVQTPDSAAADVMPEAALTRFTPDYVAEPDGLRELVKAWSRPKAVAR